MKVLLSWLREFVPDLDVDPTDAAAAEQFGEQMSDLGMAVERMDLLGVGLEGVRVARVVDTRPHPDADRIQLVNVDAGDGEPVQVCCGAFNMAPGDLVPLATVGTTMPDGMEISRRKMRGEWSNGMLCSATELRIGTDGSGILILPPDLEPGTPVSDALGITADVLYDLEINPNRPDAMSVAGVARDVAGRLGLAFSRPRPPVDESGPPASDVATVEVVDTDLCGRFLARVLRGVQVRPSDPAIAARLTAVGMRPINNVVDASNYVMLELGQPNHAYDLARLGGRGLRVRRARAGERLVTLDDIERTFTTDDLLICDAGDEPVGIAGIMGGADTEIGDATTEVLLELAWFAPMSVATTARRLGLRSEASARFERGTDPQVLELAAARFIELMGDAVGEVLPGAIDVHGDPLPEPVVELRTSKVNGLLGTDLEPDRIDATLRAIEFGVERLDSETARVTVPSWRPDTSVEVDVIEEIARVYGYDAIGRSVPKPAQIGRLTPYQVERRRVRDVMVGLGLCEAMPLPFLAPGDFERARLADEGIRLANPLVAEESVLRTNLLSGLAKAVAYNQSHRVPDVRLFEVGTVFRRPLEGEQLPDEHEMLAVAIAGAEAPEAKRCWDVLADALALPPWRLVAGESAGMHPTRTAHVEIDSAPFGVVGEVDPAVLAAFGVDGRVAYLEVDLGRLLATDHGARAHVPVSRYPSSDIDLAFLVADDVPAGDVKATIAAAGGDELVMLALFDVYRGEGVGQGERSLAYALRLQALDRTLTDDEVAAIRRRVIDAVETAHGATLRG